MSKTNVKLGVMPPLSGVVGIYGSEITHAAQVACQEVNDNGGVLGRPLEIVIEDDGSLPESAVTAAEKLLDEHHCSAIIGNLLSNSRIAVAYRVAEPRQVPYLNFSFYEGSILSRYFFHFAALPNQQIDKMIPYMCEQFGPRMFFAGNNYEWPRGSIHAGKLALEQAGGEIVGEEYTPIGVDTETIERLLDNVEAAKPDVFVPYFAGSDQVLLLTRFTERGLKNKIAVVMGHYDEMMASQLPPEVRDGFYSSNTYFMSIDSEQNKNYLSRLANLPDVNGIWPKGNGILTNFGEGTYVCVKAFAEAANKAGSLDPELLVEALRSVQVDAPQGKVTMLPEHQHAEVNTYLTRCNAEGEFNIIESFGAIKPVLPERYKHQRINHQATMEDDIRLQARMLEQLSEGILLVGASDNLILYTNAGADRMFGYNKGEMNNLSIASLIDPTVQNSNEKTQEILSVLNQKGEWNGELQGINKTGGKLWCSANISIFTHPVYGEVWLGVYHDITDRKQTDEALRLSEEMLSLTISHVPGVVYQFKIDANGKRSLPYVSPMIRNYIGLSAEILMADVEEWFALTHPDDLPSLEKSIIESMENMTLWDWEGRFIKANKEVVWLHGSSSPVGLKDGGILWLGVFINITKRKQNEVELDQYRHHLEELVDERTNELKIARDEAEQANQTKTKFLSQMSHELRTPMNAILGFTQLMETNNAEPLQPTQQECVKEVMSAGDHLMNLINQVLDLARIEANQFDVDLKPVSVPEIINKALSLTRPLSDERMLSVDNTILVNDTAYVIADQQTLLQVVINLISNAIKYNQQQGSVKLYAEPTRDGYLRINVQDSGIGIPKDKYDAVFTSFERITNSQNVDGTGIGLNVSQHMIEMMEGRIGFDSVEGEGSCFWIELKLTEKPEPD